jgi:hypothetical protein
MRLPRPAAVKERQNRRKGGRGPRGRGKKRTDRLRRQCEKARSEARPPSAVTAPPPSTSTSTPPATAASTGSACGAGQQYSTDFCGAGCRRQRLANCAAQPRASGAPEGDRFLWEFPVAATGGSEGGRSARCVSGLVGLPLSVRRDGKVETYRSRRDVERDFDQIFTPRVKSDVLEQRPYSLRTRDDGKTKGATRILVLPPRLFQTRNAIGQGQSASGKLRPRRLLELPGR